VSTAAASHLTLQRRWAGCATGASVRDCAAIPRTSFDASSIYVAQRLPSAGLRAFARAADTGATLLCDAYGGAIARRAPDATAFAHRKVRFSVQIVEFAPLAAATPDVRRARRLIAPFGTGAAYQNYPSLDLRAPLQAYYGANLPRLRAVKAVFDPDDRFRPAQRIRA